jgi:hypothetical protein
VIIAIVMPEGATAAEAAPAGAALLELDPVELLLQAASPRVRAAPMTTRRLSREEFIEIPFEGLER